MSIVVPGYSYRLIAKISAVFSLVLFNTHAVAELNNIFSLSLQELTQVNIITTTRQPEKLSQTFASTYVIQATEINS